MRSAGIVGDVGATVVLFVVAVVDVYWFCWNGDGVGADVDVSVVGNNGSDVVVGRNFWVN